MRGNLGDPPSHYASKQVALDGWLSRASFPEDGTITRMVW